MSAPAPPVDAAAHYELARERLGLDRAADRQAASRLATLLMEYRLDLIHPDRLRPRFQDRHALVLGPGRGGVRAVQEAPAGTPLVVAGSAVEAAFTNDLMPWLVVTDLDGSAEAHRSLSRWGAPTAVHAHGDNTELLESLLPELEGPVFGTCQTEPPTEPVALHRFGGFTDGDRACFLAAALGARQVELCGFELDAVEGVGDEKRVKLGIARELLEQVPVGVGGLGGRD